LPDVLTNEAIQAAWDGRQETGQIELQDGFEPGLRLRIGPRAASWSLLTRGPDAEKSRLPLGSWPKVGIEQARALAQAFKRTLHQLEADASAELTVSGLLERYRKRRLEQLRKGRVMFRALEAALDPIKTRDVTTLTRREIGTIIDNMADRAPIHANRVLAYAKAMFSWAVGRGYLDDSPATAIAKPTIEVARDRTPSIDELVEIWAAAVELGYPFGHAVRLLMLTATRRDEVSAMRVPELKLALPDATWTIPSARSKNGRAIRIPLAPLALDVVADALRCRSIESALVFTTTGDTSISGWSRAKARLDAIITRNRRQRESRAPAMPAWRLHDLRRSFATHACDVLNVDPAVADRCLNHVGASTTSTVSRIYARNELFEARRQALSAWDSLLQRTITPSDSAKAA
jgi:integrase